MLEPLLLYLSLVHVGCEILLLLEQTIPIALDQAKQTTRRFLKKRAKICQRYEGEDRISDLSDDLLVRILLFVPTKDVMATMILSKRWLSIWTMVPTLKYLEINGSRRIVFAGLLGRLLDRLFGKRDQPCIWRFLDESLQLHKAPVLETLVIQLGSQCPLDVDVGKWIVNAVDRSVCQLGFMLSWSGEPIRLPKSLYTCNTLVSMGLYNKILLDVPSLACFPSLKGLGLYHVLYKDEDSIVKFLSSCPILKHLAVHRQDNLKSFNIEVPSLECIWYDDTGNEDTGGTLVIDSPALKKLFLTCSSSGSCWIENKPHFDKARVYVDCYIDNKFMKSLSSVINLELYLSFATVM